MNDEYLFKYVFGFTGANYAMPQQDSPTDWILATSRQDIIEKLRDIKNNTAHRRPDILTADGTRIAETPLYGEPGDHAYIYAIPKSKKLKLASVAGLWPRVDFENLVGIAEFGPRGGIKIERA